MTPGSITSYARAMEAARQRFAPLAAALTRDLGLDTEPVVEQTGGMVMCLSITWPDGAYVWFSDYWWFKEDLILGLYEADPEQAEEAVYPEPPDELVDKLTSDPEALAGTEQEALDICAWAVPLIRDHGAAHGWERRL